MSGAADRTSPIAVRDAVPEDAATLARVEIETWHASYAGILPAGWLASMRPEAIHARWARGLGVSGARRRRIDVVAERGGDIVGFATGDVRRGADVASLGMLYVLPIEQRRGVGRALFRGFVARARTLGASALWLDVLAQNRGARRFYRAVGGTEIERTWRFVGTKPLVLISCGWMLDRLV